MRLPAGRMKTLVVERIVPAEYVHVPCLIATVNGECGIELSEGQWKMEVNDLIFGLTDPGHWSADPDKLNRKLCLRLDHSLFQV